MWRYAVIAAALLLAGAAQSEQIEEFHSHGPMEFHDLAMGAFLERRKIDPKENLSTDSPFMKLATEHAVKRLSRPPDEAFELQKLGIAGSGGVAQRVLELPSPEGKDSSLTSAVNAQGSQVLAQHAHASAIVFGEEIGLGAISKTGALPMGSEGQWLQLAEKKLKKDASLDYQALLWEMGSGVAESVQGARGGLNVTREEELLEGKYLGDELQKTFDKSEAWGMTIFLLHEYYKEINGKGSKWGPFIRTLRMRYLSTPAMQAVRGTIASHLSAQWSKSADAFVWWSVGIDGPCSPTTGICKVKPLDRAGESRFNIHQIRWAYWVVKQNAVRVKQMATGLEFTALIPYYNMVKKSAGAGGGVTFDLDGSVSLRTGGMQQGTALAMHPGNMSDAEHFLRYLRTPELPNPHTEIKLSLPGVIPKGSKFHYCMKGSRKEQNRDDCKASYRSESMFWKSKVLTEWRQMLNLPPRMQELRMWATRLHLYGGKEEMDLLSSANKAIAGLPLSVDQMPAEEQLM
ncbi:hypothetical protein B484DRAFT_234221 [Ochromonadaceae sp. CCMP2298]|nr:hypothetical protein B484DRAFT_234221 [Ochromonadaceae sp. CCMP2298]